MISLGGDRVAIVPIHEADMSDGRYGDPSLPTVKLFIPEEAKKRTCQGLVKYVGPKCKYTHPGQYVIYSQFSGTLTEIEGEGKLIIMQEEFIYAELHDRNIEIPGLFFKGKPSHAMRSAIMACLKQVMDLSQDDLRMVAQHLMDNGIEHNMVHFTATYEKVVELAAREFTRAGLTVPGETING